MFLAYEQKDVTVQQNIPPLLSKKKKFNLWHSDGIFDEHIMYIYLMSSSWYINTECRIQYLANWSEFSLTTALSSLYEKPNDFSNITL